MARKAVTVSIPRDVLADLDKYADEEELGNRSLAITKIVAKELKAWQALQEQKTRIN